jgi:hypothetical protein
MTQIRIRSIFRDRRDPRSSHKNRSSLFSTLKQKRDLILEAIAFELASSVLPKHPQLESIPHKIKVSITKGGRHKLNVSFSYS